MANFFEQFDTAPAQPEQVPGTVPTGRLQVTVAPGQPTADTQQPQTNYFSQFDAPTSLGGIAADVAKSVGSGLITGGRAAIGLPAAAIDLGTQGLMKLNEMAGNPLAAISPGGTGLEQAQANKEAIAKAMGTPSYEHTPQTGFGQYGKTIGEFGGSALTGGSGMFTGAPTQVAKQVAGQIVAPAVASEAVGQSLQGTSLEPAARMITGAVVGGLGAAATTGKIPGNVTREQVRQAGSDLYKSPEFVGAQATPQSVGNLATIIESRLGAQNYSPIKATEAFGAINLLKGMQAGKQAPTIANIRGVSQTLDRTAREVGTTGLPTADASAAQEVQKTIRAYLDTLQQSDLAKGDAAKIGPILQQANQNWAAQAKALDVPVTLKKVARYANKYDLPMEQAMAMKGGTLTPQEQMQGLLALGGGPALKTLRAAGSFDPTKNPYSFGMQALAAMMTGGASLPVSSIATGANRAANAITHARVNNLRQSILNNSPLGQQQPAAMPYLVPRRAVTGGLLGGFGGYLGWPTQ